MDLPKTYDYQCADCDKVEIHLVEWEDRNNPQECTECGGPGSRLWSATFSTEKLSKSIPAEAAKGRFDYMRRRQELKKEKSASRISGDRKAEKEIDKEMIKSNNKT